MSRYSPIALTVAPLALAAGLLSGLLIYLDRSSVREGEAPGTAAWVPHLALLAAGLLVLGWLRLRNGPLAPQLLAPLRRPATARTLATFRSSAPRSVGAVLLLALAGYTLWRTGVQVTAGLDPNFTTNAWGGPSYLGAMLCHYVDGAWILAATLTLLNLVLVGRVQATSRATASTTT